MCGSGNDQFDVNNSTDVVEDTFTTTNNVLDSGASYTLPTNVNALNLTNAGYVGTANNANDSLTASGGRDTLVGGAGNDTLAATGSSNDVLVAATGQGVLEDVAAVGSTTFVFNSSFTPYPI